jgi:hypothetical protein
MIDRPHVHTNPSPSQDVGAWCNGTQEDRGCGQFVPLRSFQPLNPPQRFVTEYLAPYLEDTRGLKDGRSWRWDGQRWVRADDRPSDAR